MRYEELTGRIQARAQLSDRQSAERVTRATLETLAERVPDGLAGHLADQLPIEAAEPMRRVAASHEGSPEERAYRRAHGERFDLTGFAGRVAWRAGTTEDIALRDAAALFEVLDSAVSPELMERLYVALPRDIRQLLPEARAVLDQSGAAESAGVGGAGGAGRTG
ncbi:DUF2267 domain-containing protein [Streptomyces palmae]|uniref:DUF2267 domain-containing protein n=1 Tax=Streptomyces palmae TaxID=1701085 RepID=A0A4Z0HFD9_9ACTN|nr:DUF2267 domain-containing protein [Streptomyces palmae]TGB17097.1 DUF2267 domain-containing protein [Streptomyces palmae]